jgi:hypothetical protein
LDRSKQEASVKNVSKASAADQDNWQELVRQARAQIAFGLAGRTLPPSEEILAQIREERDEPLILTIPLTIDTL